LPIGVGLFTYGIEDNETWPNVPTTTTMHLDPKNRVIMQKLRPWKRKAPFCI
jgi:hypothetical protein